MLSRVQRGVLLFLSPQPISELLHDPVPEDVGGRRFYVRHPGQHPPDQFFASGRLYPHLDAAVPARPELLDRVPLPLRDVNGRFRLEEEPNLQDVLPPAIPNACLAYDPASKSAGRENVYGLGVAHVVEKRA